MTYKFFIFVFFIYVIPFQVLKEIYLYDKDNFKIAKIINVLITLLLLLYITGPNNSIFELFYDFKSFKEAFHIDSGLINADITFIAKIIHNCLNFFMLFVVFNLTRRSEKFRRIFIYLLPLLFVLMILEVNREFFREYNSNNNLENHFGLILIPGSLWISLRFIALFFIYNSKVFKGLMCLNNSKIKELMTKK